MKKIDKSEVKRILVITLSNVGDIILTTPVVEVLLREFPNAQLDIMAGPSGKEIFEFHDKIKEVIIYDKKTAFLNKIKLFFKLRKRKYDIVVDLKNTVLPLVLGSRYITNPFRHQSREDLHKRDVHLSRLQEMGIDTRNSAFHIPVTESDKIYVDGLLGESRERPLVIIAPGAKSHVKRWPLKNFARLSDMIQKELGYKVVLIGDRNDRIVTERILFLMKTEPLVLLEKTNVRQLAHLIKKSMLLITNDSAPLHVGSAVGGRILAFFGPTDDKKYGPLTKSESRVMKRNIECSPCEVPQCVNLDNKYECLKTISPEEAFGVVKELLKDAHTIDANR